jgi:DNA polymerase (family 10)
MPRTNEELEELFNEWAELLAVSGEDGFRVRAYERAGRAIGGYSRDIAELSDAEILKIPSVGKGMAARVREYLQSRHIAELEDLREQVPGGLRDLMRVPGLGPKKAMLINAQLGIASLDELRAAVETHKLREIKGLGPKTEENIARGLERAGATEDRVLLDTAMELAEGVIRSLQEALDVDRIAYAGSLRRMRDTIGDIDVLVACADAAPVMEAFVSMPRATEVLARGETKSSILTRKGVQVDLRVVSEDCWGAALIYFTGSKAHNIKLRHIAITKGLKLSEWGLFEAESGKTIAARTEEEVYAALAVPWCPPTMREDNGEVERAQAGELPAIVTLEDIKGDLHSHTDMTDGVWPLEELLRAAEARGYAYLAVTDHAEGIPMMGVGKDPMLAQRATIQRLQASRSLTILHGTELNIAADGSVDYDPEFLAGFDICVASVHSHFRQSREDVTARLIRAMENPNVHIIGHPSGRKIGRRGPIDFDLAAVCDTAVRTGTALEVNCFPDRIDLRDEHVRYAIERGVTLTIDTDAHAPRDLLNLRYGVATAQRGWASATSVLNTGPVSDVVDFVAKKRAR